MTQNGQQNSLTVWVVSLLLIYWTSGFVVDYFNGGLWWSAFISACLLVSGGLLASTVLPDAIRVVRKGRVGPGETAVIGIALISGGLMYSGLFSLLWTTYGQRSEAWIGPVSSFGRACGALGMVLLFLAPEATRRGIRPPRWWVMLIGIILVALIGFLFGLTFKTEFPMTGAFDMSRAQMMVDLRYIRRS